MNSERLLDFILQSDQVKVGYCREGDAAGLFVMLFPLGLGEVIPGRLWDVSFSGPVTSNDTLVDEAFVISSADEEPRQFLMSLGVEWAPSEAISAAVIASMFPGTRPFATSGESPPPVPSGVPYGRFRGLEGLENIVRLVEQAGGPNSAVDNDTLQLPSEQLRAGDDFLPFLRLADALEDFGYTFAVAPNVGGLLIQEADPWAEFASQTTPPITPGDSESAVKDIHGH